MFHLLDPNRGFWRKIRRRKIMFSVPPLHVQGSTATKARLPSV
jgi:hypothetical protein